MNRLYLRNVQSCIDDKLIERVLEGNSSVCDVYERYYYNMDSIARIYSRPFDHISKVMALACRKTLKEYEE